MTIPENARFVDPYSLEDCFDEIQTAHRRIHEEPSLLVRIGNREQDCPYKNGRLCELGDECRMPVEFYLCPRYKAATTHVARI